MADPRGSHPSPSGEPAALPVLCFTGAHARLPHLLATLRRGGHPLAVRRCTTLVDFARELTRHAAELVAVDCGPGNLRLADAMAVVRRAGCRAPLVIVSDRTPEALKAIDGLARGVVLAPDDLPGLAATLRALRMDRPPPAPEGRTSAGAESVAERQPPLAGAQALLDALRPLLRADAMPTALVVVHVTPEPATAAQEPGLLDALCDALGRPLLVARLGAGSLAALIELPDPAAGVLLAHGARQRLLEQLRHATPPAEEPNVAIGISPPRATDGHDPEAWLARSLEACEVAARTEHGYAVLNRTPVTAPSVRDLPGLIQEALVGNALVLQFQPIVSLRGDARQHYETLVRLPSATAGELLPADFFGPAKASGLLSAVDHWVIRQAIRRLANERATNRRVHLFIPLSAESLADARLLMAICDELRESQATGDWLTFQVRPDDIAAHPGRTRRLVEGLRQIRCRLALERYDGESRCRELLQAVRFDFAKLAPALTRDIDRDPAGLEKARRAVAELAGRGVKSVATGVEDSQTLAYLWTIGIDYAQGFYLQEPSPSIAYGGDG
jgi:EAL domain-containing protein (putative c-di-GMP-specific phosphodiesterase class I)